MKLVTLHQGVLAPEIFGIRAARLSQATVAGAPVPEGFVIENASSVMQNPESFGKILKKTIEPGRLYALRASPGRAEWGGPHTLLALGMNDMLFDKLREIDAPVAYELYRQAIMTYAIAVMGLDSLPFDTLHGYLGGQGRNLDQAAELLEATRTLYQAELGEDFPQDPVEQILGAIRSMNQQWNSPTSRILREAKAAPRDAHLSLILQTMVHGLGNHSGVGRIQSINPETGEKKIDGFFVKSTLTATLASVDRHWGLRKDPDSPSLEHSFKQNFDALITQITHLGHVLKDAPEIKFVIDNGKLWVTEFLIARRTPRANLQVLVDLVDDGIIGKDTAISRVDIHSVTGFMHPQIDKNTPREVLGLGIAASPGAAMGQIVFDTEEAIRSQSQGKNTILVRKETTPEDIRGMHAASGVVTIRGGMTSHAAVIARGIGLPCIVGAENIEIDLKNEVLILPDGSHLRSGDVITIDGTSGEILRGAPKMIEASPDARIDQILVWANEIRRMRVRVNADTPEDAAKALKLGVDGIGLTRTEHMFFAPERLALMRRMILANSPEDRQSLLRALEPEQEADFESLFSIMRGLPVTIRLLDPPLHEFLPHDLGEQERVARSLGLSVRALSARMRTLSEFNPMLGMRGVRLGVIFPEIYDMQARAIFRAAAKVNETGADLVVPEIMIPLVSANREVELVKARVDKMAKAIAQETGIAIDYRLGVIIETPRAALRAGDIAQNCHFLSMGTNDLTQMTYGLSRDDAGRFMRQYVQAGIYAEDPFLTVDLEAVGELIAESVKRGRAQNPDLIFGVCGEHGGDPDSILFFEKNGFNYISCSPYRLVTAQIAAAQAFLKNQ